MITATRPAAVEAGIEDMRIGVHLRHHPPKRHVDGSFDLAMDLQLVREQIGSTWVDILQLMIVLSILSNTIASHNSVVRIQYGMGRARALPRQLGWTLPDRRTPYVAIAVQTAVSVAIGRAVTWRGFGVLKRIFIDPLQISGARRAPPRTSRSSGPGGRPRPRAARPRVVHAS